MRRYGLAAIGLAYLLLSVSCAQRRPGDARAAPPDWSKVIRVTDDVYFDRVTRRHFEHREFILDYASRFSEGLCAVKRRADGKEGYIDRQGRVVIPFQYDGADWFADGRAWVRVGDAQGLIDRHGRWVVEPGTYQDLAPFSEGRCAFSPGGGLWGFLDRDGKVVIPPVFEMLYVHAMLFKEGLCLVRDAANNKVCIDRWGRVAIRLPGNVSSVYPFSGGLVRVSVDIGPSDDNPLDWGRIRPRTLWGYVGRDGRMAIEPRFGTAGDFSEGLAPVTMTEDGSYEITRELISRWNPYPDFPEPAPRWGFIDTKGEVAIPFLYEKAGHFSEGLAAVKQNGSWGYIDREGRMVIGAVFEDAQAFRDGIAEVVVAEKVAYIDKHGRVIVRTDVGGERF